MRVHADDARCFSTKERCPFLCLVEVEVLDDVDDTGDTATSEAARTCAPLGCVDALGRRRREDAKPEVVGASDGARAAGGDVESPLGMWRCDDDEDDAAAGGRAGGAATPPPTIFANFFGLSPDRHRHRRARSRSPPPTPPKGADTALALARGEPPAREYGALDPGSPGGGGSPRGGRSVLAPRLPKVAPPDTATASPRRGGGDDDAPAAVVFRERWRDTERRLLDRDDGCDSDAAAPSPRRRRLVPVIVKARDDLRQEQFAAQLIQMAAKILRDARVGVRLRAYDVIATGPDGGVIEAVPDTVSLDALRRNDAKYAGLLDFFRRRFGPGAGLSAARSNFVESLAPACILSYLLQLKDRHNGNILLDAAGHVTHIDFGYMLASSPGGNLGFEAAPFKLTKEFIDVIGPDSRRFKDLCVQSFAALRRDRHKLLLLAEMTVSGCDHLPCFGGRPRETIDALQRRFKPKLSDRQVKAFVHGLIDKSANNWRTSAYDEYQRCCVGIL